MWCCEEQSADVEDVTNRVRGDPQSDGLAHVRAESLMLQVVVVTIAYCLAFTAALLWSLLQPNPMAHAVLTIVALGGLPVIFIVTFRCAWCPMLAPYPPVEPKDGAVRRRYQSFSIGLVNMGFSLHVAADETYLHLTPLPIWRRLGARPASVPWSALRRTGPRSAMLGQLRVIGPAWCMELIEVD